MPKILISDKLAEEGIKILKDADFIVDCKYKLDKEELKKVIKDYDAIIVRSQTKLTKDILEEADSLKFIGRAGVGIDNVDLETATKKGIIVMNAPGGNTVSTSEHTFALILSLARKIPYAHNSLKEKEWNRSRFRGVELQSKVLGIIGLGRIGKEVAKRGIAFGMEVLAYDPFISYEIADSLGVRLIDLKELLQKADFITIHTPLTEETKNLISFDEFALMKPTAYLINCARGGIVDEEALYHALSTGKIAGAAVDVFAKEPPLDSKLLQLENIVVTPHLGASTEEAQINVAIEIANCIKDAFLGKAIKNAVNYIQLDPETYRKIKPYMELTELMGKFISQLLQGRPKSLILSYVGEIASFKVDPLSMSFAKGFLSHVLEEEVNLVNALEIARERGIKVEQTKIPQEEEYVNLVRAKIITDEGEKVLEGTLFSNREPRFVKMDEFYIEITPFSYMMVVFNWDKPGVVGALGTVLGKHNINIAGMSLGRRAPQDIAVTVLNIDSLPSPEVIKEITSNPNIVSLKIIKL
ncbi:MAG: phosphoglycerate dehydrogenase [Candidatus Omnitrophota bacterium]|nr:MAG: phosphoglycerate dehydrogenase [Candidatus Omnitrophota bacterium]